ncbi:DUF262 domain-containing protein [Vibrio parahaemolyticus]|uniref:DUF262 domain-containing protein n=1 Tax=Vibrio parahaemolyticus TaxID=670 RepID=UPI00226AC92C|nr:DUF262 domain-containing protein [Vibrio parahaemolyticus]MCX8795765.1 DUF262 domain-containing protein [Vibrio parahaemolyticus]
MCMFSNELMVTSQNTTIGHFVSMKKEGHLYLDADYQREYVWTRDQQQCLLESIFHRIPLGGISVVVDPKSSDKYLEVVDGKQRLTTILKFVDNEFPYIDEYGNFLYYRDLDVVDQRTFTNVILPSNELREDGVRKPSRLQILKFFYRVNFGGTPQAESHRRKVANMIAEEKGI